MDKAEAEALVRRFVALPRDRRHTFWTALRENEVDLALLPIPGGIARGERREPSYAQRRMWLLWQLDREASAYHIATAQRLSGMLDADALEGALIDLCRRHEALRTTFDDADGTLAQRVRSNPDLALARLDLRDRTEDTARAELAALLRAAAQVPFDLERGPLLRATLVRLGETEHVLQLVMHHIVADAWSLRVMVDDLSALYAARLSGQPEGLAALDVQYSDYALWQRSWLEAGEGERQLAYWTEHLGGGEQALELPLDRPRPAVWSYRGAVARFEMSETTMRGLHALAQRGRTTPFVVLLTAFAVLLQRWSGQGDLRIGVPVANRTRAETEGLIGLFVNTQVIRVEVDGGASFADLLALVREAALGAQAHQDLPFEQLVDALRPERSLGRNPLFQVMFGHERLEDGATRLGELRVEELPLDAPVAQFDLALATQERAEGGLVCAFTYATDLFDAATIARLGGWFRTLLDGIAARPEQAVGDLPLLTADERRWLVESCNDTATAYDTEPGLVARLRRQAVATPEATALVAGLERLDYRELHDRADRLAAGLRAQGIEPDTLVGLLAERSVAMVVGLLAILKAGAAWVPLDPELPPDRLAYMVAQSGMRLVLAQKHLQLPACDVPIRVLEQDGGDAGGEPTSEPHSVNLAYCIYTSGTTGRPKGVGNSHAGLLNRLHWMQARYRLTPADRVLQKTPFGFDVSVWEFLWPLMTGATLVMAPPGAHRDPAALRALIQAEGITVLHFVPSMLQAFMAVEDIAACSSLRAVICSGEALPVDLQRRFLAASPAGLHNLYGPTEAAIDVTAWECRDEPGRSSVPIGTPIANTRIHLLDGRLSPVPVGVLGELCIGGVQLARGYVGRPGLTAERFVPDPDGDGSRLYRTGDLARRRSDGVIEYAGRTDHQVKIRGFRIELEEIEVRLVEHPGVNEALVIARDGPAGRQLVAYVVGDASADALKEHLRRTLPDYMVPARFVSLDRLPLSANGKLDRNALPDPDWPEADLLEPATPTERLLCQAWQDLLGLPKVGTSDNFFDLGGDSILAIQLVGRARSLGLRLSPRDVFRHQTVRELAAVAQVDQALREQRPEARGEAALLPIQHWFFEQPMPNRSHWNQAVLLQPRERVDRAALEGAIGALIAHHEALRLRFECDAQGEWRQLFVPADDLAGRHLAVRSAGFDELDAVVAAAHTALDIGSGRVVRAELIGLPDRSERLLLVIHHLVVDGVSWRILLEDLATAYGQAKQGQPPSLPDRTSSVQQWATALAERARDGSGVDWWETQLSGPVATLPGDRAAEANLNRDAAQLLSSMDRALTTRLLTAPNAYRMRVDELLLAALTRGLCAWSGGEAVLVQLEGHGREEELTPGVDLSRTVGWLTSLYPMRLAAPADRDPDALLKSVKEQLRAVPDRGLGFGLLRYLAPTEMRERMQALPAPEVTFNYLGRFDSSFGDDAPFLAATESSGEGLAPDSPMISPLTLDAQIHDGVLSLDWRYSRTRFDETAIRSLAAAFEGTLFDLIEHCATSVGVTPSDFPLAELTQAQLDSLPLPPDRIEDVLPLAPMQEGLLMHTLLEPGSGIYLMQEHYFIDSPIEPEAFLRAWRLVLDRNAAMRATFHWSTGGQVVQAILREPDVPMELFDWSGDVEEMWRGRLDDLLAAELGVGFDLRRTPPIRIRLIRLAAERFCLVLSYHHILMDAWSRSHLLDDLLVVYRDLQAGVSPAPRDAAPFRSFIAWLRGQDEAATRAFWGRTLEGFAELTPLPAIRPAPWSVEGLVVGDVITFLTEEETGTLRELAHKQQLTVNSFVQAAWALMLHLYSGRDDVLFGVTVAGRPADGPEFEKTVGLFISSIPLRVRLPEPAMGRTVAEWLGDLQAQNLAMREHEHLPLVAIAECSELPRGTPLFDSLFVFESEPVNFSLADGAAGLSARADSMRTHTNYPLTVVIYPGDTLGLHYSYDRRFLDDAAMPELLERFKRLLLRLAEGINRPVRQLRLLDTDERATLVAAGNSTARDYTLDRGYAPLFSASVARYGDRVAVSCAGEQLTYAALNRQANRVGHALLEARARPDDVVAVLDERGLELLTMILGTLKASAAFLALDPALPPQRLRENLRTSGARIILCGDMFTPLMAEVLADAGCRLPVLRMGELAERELPTHDPEIAVGPRHLAYLIHTSGSTGRPKGVMVEQAGMLNNQLSKIPRFDLTPDDVIAQTASQAFDISVWQFLTALLCGARVEIVPDAIAHDPQLLLSHVARSGVTVLECVPSVIQAMLLDERQDLGRLRWLLPTGEALPPEVARDWYRRYPGVPLVNAYGPAECSDDVALHLVVQSEDDTGYVPIGTATDNNRLYVLDAALGPSPVGATGELCVAGTGVGRGYVGAPALTATAFLPDPFAVEPGGRLYRTGDLARRRPDGLIEFVGRADQQVKIRGFRIELGEIEARLREHPAVREACVIATSTPAGDQLVGYATVDLGAVEPEELRMHLRSSLPDYMVPAQLLLLDNLPRLPSGKLDRRSLPVPEWQDARLVAPRTPVEADLAEIWAELLGLERVGVTDDFYQVGGHSLLLTRLLSRVRASFAVEVPLAELFGELTVEGMARRIEARRGTANEDELDAMADILAELEQVP